MLTGDAREPQRSLGLDDFRRELIRRFFNPQSYFFLCVSTQLQNVPSIAKDLNEDDYLLIGQVLEELVHTDDVFNKLEQLSKLKRFQDFCDYLEEGVLQLREHEPSPENMKQTIQGMAHFMVDTLIDILHEPDSREHLVEIIGKKNSSRSAERVDINESLIENLYNRAALDDVQPARLTDDDIAPPFKQNFDRPIEEEQHSIDLDFDTEELAVRNQHTVKSEPAREHAASATDDALGDFSFHLQDEVKLPSEAPLPAISTIKTPPAGAPPVLIRSREPQAMHDNASRQILGIIKQVIDEFSEADRSTKKMRWAQLRKLLQSLREIAMINGLEEVEGLAFKGWRLLEVGAQRNISLGPPWKELYRRLGNSLESVVRDDRHDMPDLLQLSATFNKLIEHPENIEGIAETPAPQRKKDEQKVVVVSHDETNARHFKLPGEDDSELISLINEVRRDRKDRVVHNTEEKIDAPKRPETADTPIVAAEPPSLPQHIVHKPAANPHPLLKQFHNETEIYFEIAEEAVRNLRANPSSRLALDSLELAAYSLKVAARKLAIETCARFPEHIEEFVKGALSGGVALDERHLQTIQEGLQYMKRSDTLDEIENATMRNFSNQILRYTKAIDGMRQASQSGQKASELPSHTNQSPQKDAIDFLMADDLELEP